MAHSFRSRLASLLRIGVGTYCLLPFMASVTPVPDSSSTTLQIGAGAGAFNRFHRGCGEPAQGARIPFEEGAIAVTHRTKDGLTFGGRVGVSYMEPSSPITGNIAFEERLFWYAGPSVGIDLDMFGGEVGFGLMGGTFSIDTGLVPIASVRVGSLHGLFGSASIGTNIPLMSSGHADFGLGYYFDVIDSRIWLGAALEPYDAAMYSLKGDIDLPTGKTINLHALLGKRETIEYAFALGLTLRL